MATPVSIYCVPDDCKYSILMYSIGTPSLIIPNFPLLHLISTGVVGVGVPFCSHLPVYIIEEIFLATAFAKDKGDTPVIVFKIELIPAQTNVAQNLNSLKY